MKNIPITQNTSIQFLDDEKRDKSEGTANELVLGTSGSGKAIRPWEDLKPCPKCGCNTAWLAGKDGTWFNSGSPYKVVCIKCGYESISSDDFQICKKDWNDNILSVED